ncbi:MAG: glycine--tRNA ligase [Methanotrichaceae archaeon]
MDKYEKVIGLARRRGFIWPAFELYGGAAGFYDYGPLGALLKKKIEDLWREFFVIREGFCEIECPTVGVEDIYKASGHLSGFSDPLTECKECGEIYRADHLIKHLIEVPDALSDEEIYKVIKENDVFCPECGGELSEIYEFNLMFKTAIGPGSKQTGYLRPETAQGMFIDFPRLLRYYRGRLPFGAVQIGKSYRNEISPRQGVIRLREFSQAEAEIFIDPHDKTHTRFHEIEDLKLILYSEEDQEKENGMSQEIAIKEAVEKGIIAHQALAYYMVRTYQFLMEAGISRDRMRFRQHKKDEMAHYAVDCWDVEALLDRFGWIELVGVADRTDYDLKSHMALSQANLTVFVPFDHPQKQKKLVVKPDMKKLGPLFRNKAKAVADILKSLDMESLKRDPIAIDLDGETLEIDPRFVSFEMTEEEIKGEEIVPHVIEPSFGIDRILYTVLEHSCHEEMVDEESRTVLKLLPKITPIQVAVLPLMDRDELMAPAEEIANDLKSRGIYVEYDSSGSIGRRYRRNDEVGTPYSITVDYETLDESTVTIRDRDSMDQILVNVEEIPGKIQALLKEEIEFSKAGTPVQS